MEATLYTLPGSHPGEAARLMLVHKGIPYKRVDMMPALHKPALRLMGFPGDTVPALKIDGRKVQTSRRISRELDRLRPDPPLFPADPERRAAVEEAERFGDEELQQPIRQLLWWSFKRNRAPLASYAEGAKLPIPTSIAVRTAAPVIAVAARYNEASDENVRAALARLGGQLQRVDDLVAAGTLGGAELNAADFQIAPSLALAMTLDDLRPLIEPRPGAELVRRIGPQIAGRFPPVLPRAWLEPLRASTPA